MIVRVEKSKLYGEVEISGGKNAFFPAVGAGIALGANRIKISNTPKIKDIDIMLEILKSLGCSVRKYNDTVEIDAEKIQPKEVPQELFGKIRGAIVIFGALLGRFGKVKIPMPGGCRIGERPIDQHIKAAHQLGFYVKEENKTVEAHGIPKDGKILFDIKTVTGTENAILMSVNSCVEIENFAKEPEVIELINNLKKFGVKIEINNNKLLIDGKHRDFPDSVEFRLIPDRIEAGTFIIAGAATGGHIKLRNVIIDHLRSTIDKLKDIGVNIIENENEIEVIGRDLYEPTEIVADSYPAFPTDLQPQITVLLTKAKGKSILKDNVFPERLNHVFELIKLGANIKISEDNRIIVYPSRLRGSRTNATDLRSSAALVIAGLIAEDSPTFIENFEILERGYENFVYKLRKIGGYISIPMEAEHQCIQYLLK